MPITPLFRGLKVVGTFFRSPEEREQLITLAGRTDVPVAFRMEPENPHDAHAVAVLCEVGGEYIHAGYLPATISGFAGRVLTVAEPGELSARAEVSLTKKVPEIVLHAEIGHE